MSSTPFIVSCCVWKMKLILKVVVVVVVVFELLWANIVNAQTRECDWDIQCEELYRAGSKCLADGQCSNPFSSGCLFHFHTQLTKWDDSQIPQRRVCNSDDANQDFCDVFPLNYSEVRVHNGDWESSIFYSWIIQIFLGEFLQVPVTVGLSSEETPKASFYNPSSEMRWSTQPYAFEGILKANEMNGRCDLTKSNCVHVMPEVWIGQEKKWKEYLVDENIDQVNGDGQVGKISWYIPVYTARRYPQVASYHGMAGRRQELATIFKRPTSWKDYCSEVSPTSCLVPNGIATRSPEEGEENMYFAGDDFIGYFRPTNRNNCTTTINCTGHIVGAPCTWSTNIDAQAYHNDIALESEGPLEENGGYSYSQMIQIWRAANATSSDVIMWWWTPDATIEEFRGSPFEFQQVLLPEPTAQCREARIQPMDRCNSDRDIRRGNAGGGCDNEANSLQKVLAVSLREMTYETPEVDRSPGYQAILNLKVSHLEMNIMLRKWVLGGRSGYAAREAVCEWIIEHQEELASFIPRGYPRIFADDSSYNAALMYAAMAVGGFAVALVLVMFAVVFYFSNTKVFVYAQVPFIFMVLLGLFLVACGSIFFALKPRNSICVSQVWLITLGYTLELVPLLVKVAAINRLMSATRRMRRIKISMQSLFCTVACLVLIVIMFLAVWTAVDTPKRHEGRYLVDEDHSEIVTTVICASDSGIWDLVVICWNGLLIVCATVLAFQSRAMKQEFNEARSLGTMIYSHFVFGVLRTVVSNLGGSDPSPEGSIGYPTIDPSIVAAASSFLLSMDVITAVTIYIFPKIEAARKAPQPHNASNPGQSETSGSSNGFNNNNPKTGSRGGTDRTTRPNQCDKRSRVGFILSNNDDSKDQDHLSVDSTQRRISMDGSVHTNDDKDYTSRSSEEMNYEGPILARSSSAEIVRQVSHSRGFGSRNTCLVGIGPIEEEGSESGGSRRA